MALHPIGPLPASTYWRRRAVLLVGLLVAVLAVRACAGGARGVPAAGRPSPSATPSSTTKPSAAPSPSRTASGVCPDRALTLTTTTDASDYPVAATARFTLTVKNVSSTACRRDLGSRAVEVVVASGADRIWSSADCGSHVGTALQTLRPGASLETTVTWAGRRSARGCPAGEPLASPGTYTVSARLGTLTSPIAVFRVHR